MARYRRNLEQAKANTARVARAAANNLLDHLPADPVFDEAHENLAELVSQLEEWGGLTEENDLSSLETKPGMDE